MVYHHLSLYIVVTNDHNNRCYVIINFNFILITFFKIYCMIEVKSLT
jgi:hypothetical protein